MRTGSNQSQRPNPRRRRRRERGSACDLALDTIGVVVLAGILWLKFLEHLEAEECRREEQRQAEARSRAEERQARRQSLSRSVVTSTSRSIEGKRVKQQLGTVFSKWHERHPDSLPAEYAAPYDGLQLHDLVELTLKYKARELVANAVVNVRIRSFKNGCEGSGDAVLVE